MRRTKHIYLPALAAVLLMGCVILLVGTTFARYQMSSDPEDLAYQAKKHATVYLWSNYFDDSQSTWEVVNRAAGGLSMEFYVSNGTDTDDYAETDQQVTVRLAATLGIQDEEGDVEVALRTEEGKTYLGTAQPILENTPLYASFGAGWLYTFLDEDGEELSWTLEGGTLSVLAMQMYVQGVTVEDTSLLQLQVSGDISGR